MQIGFVGSGNMARAMARGWARPVLCTAASPGRAEALARETGGEALASNAELAKRADVVVLAHKPGQLAQVAAEVAPHARTVVSVLGGTDLATLRAAYPGAEVARTLPSTPAEVRRGATLLAAGSDADDALRALLRELGPLVELPEGLMGPAGAMMSVTPAYYALLAEAQVDAGVRHGLPARTAAELVEATMGGTAALLAHRDHDTLAVRREVTSPGGMTARGLEALEAAGLRDAFARATEAVVAR